MENLLNFDSRQIYKYLDIITGKDKDDLTIWLYDTITPDQYFSSYDFVNHANYVIKDIKKRGKTPILVGGSYFYLKHLLYGFDVQVPPNQHLREELNNRSVDRLQRILISINPLILKNMNQSDRNNPRRLIRRIEIESYKKMGVEISGKNLKSETGPNFLFLGVRYKNKSDLINAIKIRVEKRLKQGAINEVKKILNMGYKKTDPGLKTIGYKQIIDYLEKNISKEEAIKQWVIAEIHYAKRQYTFMKKDKNIRWKEI